MKKKVCILFCVALCALMTFLFFACGEQDDNRSDDSLCGGPPVYESEIDEFVAKFDRRIPFNDNQVIVVLTEKVSLENIFHDYAVEDFSDVGTAAVEELDGSTSASSGLTYKIRQGLLEDPSGDTISEHLKNYKRIFCITLDKKDEDNVLRAVYVLRQRNDIYFAEPNWIVSMDV